MVSDLALVLASDIPEMKGEASGVESRAMTKVSRPVTEDVDANPVEGSHDDNEEINIEEDNNDIQPMKPSHMDFWISTIKEGHIQVLTESHYISDVSLVQLGGKDAISMPKEDKGVVFRSFLKAALWFPLHKMLVAVLKIFNIYLHQLTPKAIMRLGVFLDYTKPRCRTKC